MIGHGKLASFYFSGIADPQEILLEPLEAA